MKTRTALLANQMRRLLGTLPCGTSIFFDRADERCLAWPI